MKETIATIGVVSAVLIGGVTADNYLNPYADKGLTLELSVSEDTVSLDKMAAVVTLDKWHGEEQMSIAPVGVYIGTPERSTFSNVQKYASLDGKSAFIVEPTENGVNLDTILYEKPATNIFSYAIAGWEDLDFFYQDALYNEPQLSITVSCTETQCVDKDGNVTGSRPENVVGSYAVYHKSKKDNGYQTGKLYHIYRPKIIDDSGIEIWGTLHYENGSISVTVPQDFLDTAAYPVRVDPTFGYTSIGASETGGGAVTDAGKFTAPEAGTVTTISVYSLGNPSDTRGGMYSDNAGTPNALLGTSVTSTAGASYTWNVYTLTSPYAVTGGTPYWLSSSYTPGRGLKYDTGGSTNQFYYSQAGGEPVFRDPFSPTGSLDWIPSMYATYTAAGGAAPLVPAAIIYGKLIMSGQVKI